jgi:prepilin-type N-terminal cleavage/methylation domain-containing protein
LGRPARAGFTLLEVLVVVLIIGILATLGYASLMDLIFTNRAKESAQIMRTFAERSIAEGKRQNRDVTISLSNGSMTATINDAAVANATLSSGFNRPPDSDPVSGISQFAGNTAISTPRLGFSGIIGEGYFAACGARGYCGGAVKTTGENSFRAYIRRGTNANWEAL